MKYLPHIFIASFILCAAVSTASANPPLAGQAKDASPASVLQSREISAAQWNLNVRAPLIETELAAFVLQGKRKTDKICISDMDILVKKDGKRLIPLLRFLRLIEATGELSNDMIIFKVEGGQLTPLDILNKTLQVDDKKVPIDIEIGVSDITNAAEIYVSEEVLKEAFGFDFVWDPERVEYTITTDKELEIFKRRRLKIAPVSLADIKKMSESLPETEPPARPKAEKPLLSFFQTESRSNIKRQWPESATPYYIDELPSLNAWGSIFNGDYKARLCRNIVYPDLDISKISGWIDKFVWTSKNDNFAVNVGDGNMGLSDLVGPAVNLLGVTFKWLPVIGNKGKFKDRFFKMSRPSFLPDEKFEGYAPLDSTVELYINNRLIQSKKVEEFDGAPVGYGYYRFDGVGLMIDSVNEIKFVIKRPDGTIEESRREILNVDQLLPAGQLACMGGTGTKKSYIDNETKIEGNFSGLQALYGFSKDLTLGFTAAIQDKFSMIKDEFSGEYYSAPKSYHVAQEARYRLFNKLFCKYNVAASYDPFNDKQAFASTADLEYHLKKGKLDAQLFSFDPGYSNGVICVDDRRGYSLSGTWQVFEKLFLRSVLLHIFNNIYNALEETKKEDLMIATAEIRDVIPRSILEIQAGYMNRLGGVFDTIKGNLYSLELQSSITDNLNTEIYYSFGDNINQLSIDDLSYGLSLPDLSSFHSYSKKIKANYRITPSLSISPAYYESNAQKGLEFSATYDHKGEHRWSSRLELGTDLNTLQYYARENLEFELDKKGDNRIGLRAGINQSGERYDAGFYVTMKNMFALKEGRIDDISALRIYPERGGIQGFVYLDLNCNGHRDKGEPGVPGIAILVDDRQCTESDKHGDFYILRKEEKEMMTISLDMNSLPAIYTPTQGVQKAYTEESSFTPVNLGVCVLAAASGEVKGMDNGSFVKNISGVSVLLVEEGRESVIIKDSITAYDGSFYFGQIKPGNYMLKIDPDTIPANCQIRDNDLFRISVTSSAKPVELENCNLYLDFKKAEEVSEEAATGAKESKPAAAQAGPIQDRRSLIGEIILLEKNLIKKENVLDFMKSVYSNFSLPAYYVQKKESVSVEL